MKQPLEGVEGPRVTVVVPTYKRPDLLRECLGSIQRQTYGSFVVLVCDNSPEREGADVVAALQDPRFHYVPRPRNLGLFGNAITGFREVQTELVMEVDDDDVLLPDCLKTLVDPFDRVPGLSLVFADFEVIDEHGVTMDPARRARYLAPPVAVSPGLVQPFTHLAACGRIFFNAALARWSAIEWDAIPPEVGTAFDRHICLDAARGGRAAYHVDQPVMGYRIHSSSDGIVNSVAQQQSALFVLRNARLRVEVDHRAEVDAEILRTRLFLLRALLAEGARRQAVRTARDIVRTPPSWRAATLATRTYLPARMRRARKRHRQARDVTAQSLASETV